MAGGLGRHYIPPGVKINS